MLNNLILIICICLSCVSSWILKKIKKKEIFKSPSWVYYSLIILLNLLLLICPLAFVKKCFLILLVSPLMYQCFLDFETLELSDILSGIVLLLGVAYVIITKQYYHIATAFLLLAIYSVLSLLGPVGFGDVKLIFGLGLFVNHYLSLLFYPFLISIVFELLFRLCKKNKHGNYFAFGPYIVLGFYLTMMVFENILIR